MKMKHPFVSRTRCCLWSFQRQFGCLLGCLLLLAGLAVRASDQFGDISVSPNAMYTGNTFHGYAEIRVELENDSTTKTHTITLVYPNRDFNSSGNSISRISRTVSLAPGTKNVVTLLQPPLPLQGDGSIGVVVDGRHEGEVHAPNANDHCSFYSRGGQQAAVLVSRSLDYDATSHAFEANAGAFSAAKAVGAPDASGGGWQANAWMPDTRRYGLTNWLEVDYATPQPVNQITVYNTQSPSVAGTVAILIGTSGTNIAKATFSSSRSNPSGPGWIIDFTLPVTSVPVKTVRLDFGKNPPHTIGVDAVQITGPTGSQWASDARASSDNTASAGSYGHSGPGTESVESLRSESPVAEWSENWLAYSPFEAVIFNAADQAAMTPAVFAALGNYIHAGGNVVLLGASELPPAWHAVSSTKLHDGAKYEVGFGSVFVLSTDNAASLNAQTIQQLRQTVRDTARYFQNLPDDGNAANGMMPVVENLKIPTRGIVVIMLLFIIVIGPVNIIYLNRIKRRTWMLWTIPAISLATTLLVFVYSLLREGITPDTRISGLTVLDQTSHNAATIGGEAFYCPLTPSSGLFFEYGTEATPLVSRGYGSGTSREVDWTQSQHFQRGWVASRVPVHFHVRKTETRRERIQVVSANGRLEIINSLGAPIKMLWLADSKMHLYLVNNVAAGEKGGLIEAKSEVTLEKTGPERLLTDISFAANPDTLHDNFGKYLRPNTYIAVLDGNPFIENALGSAANAKRTRTSAVVFGSLAEEEKVGGGQP